MESISAADTVHVFFGTYTNGKSEGIYAYEIDFSAGKSKLLGVTKSENPSFLAIHPDAKYLYAVNELTEFEGEKSGAVSAYSLDAKTGTLKFLNQKSSSGGAPCHIVIDSAGRNALIANYDGGNVSVLRIEEDGRLGERSAFVQHAGVSSDSRRRKKPHAHSINLDLSERFAVAADLGLDQMLVYRFDAEKGTLEANQPPYSSVKPGGGPRHFAFHPAGKFAYVINETTSAVTAFRYDGDRGVLREIQMISTLPSGYSGGNSTAECQVHPSGKFLYGSNRGHDSIAVYSIDAETGKLTHVENELTGGKTPRNFGIDPGGRYLLAANQGSDNVVVFEIDEITGALTPTGQKIEVPSPVCVKFLQPSR